MADHADKSADSAGKDKDKSTKKAGIAGLLTKLPVLLSGAMVLEAVVLFAGFKFVGGGAPHPAAAELVKAESAETDAASADGEHGKAADGEKKKDAPAHGEKEPAAAGEHGAKSAEADAGAAGGHDAPKGEGHGEAADAKAAGHDGGDKAAEKVVVKRGKRQPVELAVVEFRAPNKVSGKTFIYDVSVFAVTKGENEAKLRAVLKEREATVKDRIRTIIAQSDPEKLGGGSEPGLETLRRQIKHQLDDLAGDEIVDEILIPRCIPFRVD